MHEVIQHILYFFGHGLCHQYPERSLEAGGWFFSVCARDTGIYLGLIITLEILLIMYARTKEKPAAMPPTWAVVVGIVLIFPMAADGMSSYLGLRETSNLMRYLTGYLCGTGVALLASGGMFSLWARANHAHSAARRPTSTAAVLVASSAVGAAFYLAYPFLGGGAPLLAFTAQWLAIVFINLLVMSTTSLWRNAPSTRKRTLIFLLSLIMALAEMALLSLVVSGFGIIFPWYEHL